VIIAEPGAPFLSGFKSEGVPNAYYTLYNADFTIYRARTAADTYLNDVASALITIPVEWEGFIKWENSTNSRYAWDVVKVAYEVEVLEGEGL
jgi:hypothetical protein